jgi:hypothetical protein
MNSRRKWQIIGAIAAAIVLIVGISWVQHSQTSRQARTIEQPQTASISLSIQSLYRNKQVSVSAEETVLQVLQALDTQDSQMQLATKEYSGLGTMVTGLHGLQNGTSKQYWQYKVNDVMPQVGAGDYKLKNGDSVEWFFGASQE